MRARLVVALALLLSACRSHTPARRCWNEREEETWSNPGRVVRTCCQDVVAVVPFDPREPTGPATCYETETVTIKGNTSRGNTIRNNTVNPYGEWPSDMCVDAR